MGWLRGVLSVWLVCTALPVQTQPATVDELLAAVVGVQATVPATARTAGFLGTERSGSGVVIADDGLTLTIGYLIMEAASAELELADGSTVPAQIVAYDHDTGLGLLRPLQAIAVTPIPLGDSATLKPEDRVLVATVGGRDRVRPAVVVARREFAGYWEYLLEDAIFTTPPYPAFGGAALIGPNGDLLGIGSLAVGDALEGATPLPGNLFIPINALKPILADLLEHGRTPGPARPWLGLYVEEWRGHLLIDRVAEDSPADKAGITADALIVRVAGQPVTTLAGFYRQVWAQGEAGVKITLTLLSGGELRDVTVTSGDRLAWLRLKPNY